MGNKFKINRNYLICFSLLILVILVRLPTLFLPIDNDTGATAYHARLILNGEPLYGTHHPAHHLPGIFYTYAAIFAILGDRPSSLQLVLMVWVWINAILILKIGKTISSTFGGILSAIFFIFITSMTNIMGDTAEIELFANLPLTGIIWLGFKIIKEERNIWSEFLIGIISAFCFLYKANYFASLIAVTLAMVLLKLKYPENKKWPVLLGQYAVMFLGFTIVNAFVIGYFLYLGLLNRFLMVFQFGFNYVSLSLLPWYYVFLVPLIRIIQINIILVIFGVTSVIRRFFFILMSSKMTLPIISKNLILVLWILFSLVSAGLSRFGFAHYVILLVPPLALLAGTEISDLWEKTKSIAQARKKQFFFSVIGIFTFFIFGTIVLNSKNYLSGFWQFASGEKGIEEFAISGTKMGAENVLAYKIAEHIKENSTPADKILNWSDLAQIYYIADRRASVDVIWPLSIPLLGDPIRALEPEPTYIITGPVMTPNEKVPLWLISYLQASYKRELFIEQYQVYKHLDSIILSRKAKSIK